MEYYQAMNYINSTLRFGSKPGLETIIFLLEHLGNPHMDMKVVHVAGTNGKGSTAAIIARVLQEGGYRVGLFTSPYLEVFTERIQINGIHISKEKVGALVSTIKNKIDLMESQGMRHPTEFEIVTALGFLYFKQEGVDFLVLEVGLGGRLDATNVVNPLISVITSISMDHCQVLGDTVEKIAWEKAGIIKHGGTVISYPQAESAIKVIMDVSEKRNAELIALDEQVAVLKKFSLEGQVFDYAFGGNIFKQLEISLLGKHQTMNAAVAITAILVLRRFGIYIDERLIRSGLKDAKWPGRLEIISYKPMMILDGAHNPDSMEKLGEFIDCYLSDTSVIMVIGMLKDKDVIESIKRIIPFASTFITTTPDSPRAMKADELGNIIRGFGKDAIAIDSVEDVVDFVIKRAQERQLVLFCGSLYMIGRVRSILRT